MGGNQSKNRAEETLTITTGPYDSLANKSFNSNLLAMISGTFMLRPYVGGGWLQKRRPNDFSNFAVEARAVTVELEVGIDAFFFARLGSG